jgi:hypothetical protein
MICGWLKGGNSYGARALTARAAPALKKQSRPATSKSRRSEPPPNFLLSSVSVTTMISFALILALLPATLLASPTLNKIQDILRSETSGTNTLAKASIQVQNSLPVDAYIYLYHWRGNDESTKQKLEWDWTFSGATTAGIDVKFETSELPIQWSLFYSAYHP